MFTWKKTQTYFLNLLIKNKQVKTGVIDKTRWLTDGFVAVPVPDDKCFVIPKQEFNIASIICPRDDVRLSFTGKSLAAGKRVYDIFTLPSGQEYYLDQKLLAVLGDESKCPLYAPANGKGRDIFSL